MFFLISFDLIEREKLEGDRNGKGIIAEGVEGSARTDRGMRRNARVSSE